MKKITVFLWCSVFLCSIMTHAQSSEIPTHLVIDENDGDAISFLLRDKPKITFPNEVGNFLLFSISTTTTTYRMRTLYLNKIRYSSETKVTEILTDSDNTVRRQGDQLCFSSNKPNAHISVIDIKGNIIMSETIDYGNYYFSLSDLLPGTYIAKINNTTIKFIKQ